MLISRSGIVFCHQTGGSITWWAYKREGLHYRDFIYGMLKPVQELRGIYMPAVLTVNFEHGSTNGLIKTISYQERVLKYYWQGL